MPPRPDYLNQGFLEAIAAFLGKQAIPTDRWNAMSGEAHEWAFTVAGLTRVDLLEDVQYLVGKALTDGTSLEDFEKQFDRLIGRKGWQPTGNKSHRIRTILESNIRSAYRAGRYEQTSDPELRSRRPYLMWKHRTPDPDLGGNPRPTHKALDGKVFRADHPFWQKAYPSCAFGCRCSVYALSDRDLQRMGKTVEEPPDPSTIADPGWDHTPGVQARQERDEYLGDRLNQMSPEMRQQWDEGQGNG